MMSNPPDRANDPARKVSLRSDMPNYDPRTWSSMGYRADDSEHSPNASGSGVTSQPTVGIKPEQLWLITITKFLFHLKRIKKLQG